MAEKQNDHDTQSRRIIDRVGQESDASMIGRMRNHMAGRDANQKDWAELWGTRIGRIFGLALLVYLVYWLISFVAAGG